ncbi:MAG: hypothetical protein MZW92_16595 [Comamonadaceae bacterium]|nr:hypothetical protein [Comamonadaceae bacterium]
MRPALPDAALRDLAPRCAPLGRAALPRHLVLALPGLGRPGLEPTLSGRATLARGAGGLRRPPAAVHREPGPRFYRALDAAEAARTAAQARAVAPGFRFVVKAPAALGCDPARPRHRRPAGAQPQLPGPGAGHGVGARAGAGPGRGAGAAGCCSSRRCRRAWRNDPEALHERLAALWAALAPLAAGRAAGAGACAIPGC